MGSRIDLHNLLVELLGSRNVYYQPPENLKLNYPCIVYTRIIDKNKKADNLKYLKDTCYRVTYIDTKVDSPIVDKIYDLNYCEYENHFVSNNLSHDSFKLYF